MQIETEDHRVDTSATNQTNYISTNSIPQSYFFICLMSLHTLDMFAMFLIIYGKMQHGFCCCSEVNVSVLVLCNCLSVTQHPLLFDKGHKPTKVNKMKDIVGVWSLVGFHSVLL